MKKLQISILTALLTLSAAPTVFAADASDDTASAMLSSLWSLLGFEASATSSNPLTDPPTFTPPPPTTHPSPTPGSGGGGWNGSCSGPDILGGSRCHQN